MYLFLTVLFLLCIVFPLYHTMNALFSSKKTPAYMDIKTASEKGMSILLPCYNEENILKTTIDGFNHLNYTNYELVFINDGSTDQTLNVLINEFRLFPTERIISENKLDCMPIKQVYQSAIYPNVIVIDKENGGKADSLNCGINYSTKEIVVTLDADSILDADALTILNQAFQDQSVISAGGNVHILQGRELTKEGFIPTLRNMKQIVRFQILEYLRGFYVLKSSLSNTNALSIISGAFGAFKRDVLLNVDGYRKTIGEDIDITLKIQQYAMKRKGLKIIFVPESICYTEAPESWKDLFNQRVRWQKAFMDCLFKYAGTFLKTFWKNPVSFFFVFDSFLVGVVASYFTGFFLLTLVLSVDSLSSNVLFVYIGGSLLVNLLYILTSLFIANSYGVTYNKKNLGRVLSTILLDLFVFRFINLFYIMIGSVAYLFNKEGWNKVSRTGRVYTIDKTVKQSA